MFGQADEPERGAGVDIIQSFRLTALTDGWRISHVECLREDPTIPELFGMESVVGDDTVRWFFKSVDPVLGSKWIARNVKPMWGALPDRIVMDWDSTVQPKYGHQEGAEIGYIRVSSDDVRFIRFWAWWPAPGCVRRIASARATR